MKLCWSVKRIFYTYPSKLSSNSSKNVEFGTTVNLVTGQCSIVFSVVSWKINDIHGDRGDGEGRKMGNTEADLKTNAFGRNLINFIGILAIKIT